MSDSVKPEDKSTAHEPPKAAEEIPTTSEPVPAAGADGVTPVADPTPAEPTLIEEKKGDEEPKEITHGTLQKAHSGLLA